MQKAWHSIAIEEIYQILGSSFLGLSKDEAKRRLLKNGGNKLIKRQKQNLLVAFLQQFSSPVVYILLIVALITFFLQHLVDTYVIMFIVFLNACFGFFYEYKADKTVEKLEKLMVFKSRVKRDGVLVEVPAEEIVVGDVVEVASGDKVPADLRIIEANNLRLDEAVLTGESLPQEKKEEILPENTLLGDRKNMLYGGTNVISGHALGIVVATGANTEFGKISQEVKETVKEKTPLQIKLEEFAKTLLFLILIITALIFFIGLFKGVDFVYILLTALSMAISAIPEGLPAVITITLATGAFRMARRNAVVRKLAAVETLGSATVIASDKTGTLTHNQMTVTKMYSFLEKKTYQISGSGYQPKGEIFPPLSQTAKEMVKKSAACCDAELVEENQEWRVIGDPTEGAILTLLAKAGIYKEEIVKQYPRLDEIPFETEKGYMATLHQGKRENLLVVKGKFETVLKMCSLSEGAKKEIEKIHHHFATSALRVLLVAEKKLPKTQTEIRESDLGRLTLLGLLGMFDPPREEAIRAIEIAKTANIIPLMITGDYRLTALAVARELNIAQSESEVFSAEEIATQKGRAWENEIRKCRVFARITPETKLKIVEALQKQGEIVAVTGDGVNDAPALKRANIGIVMGEGSADVAKEVADLILVDNNFASIVAAIEEGRTILQNIKRVIFYLLSTNFGELLIIFFTMLFFTYPFSLPLSPVQILWINLVTDSLAAMALALEPAHQDTLKFAPRKIAQGILNLPIYLRIILVALLMLFCTFLFYSSAIKAGASIEKARTVAFTTMVFLQIFNTFNCRSFVTSVFRMPFFSNKYVLISVAISSFLTLCTIYLAPFQAIFHTVPLSPGELVLILGASLLVIIGGVEIEKIFRRRFQTSY